jgi:hypothetical protein
MISIADTWNIKHVPFPVFQYAIDLNVRLPIGRDPSAFLNISTVCLWEPHLSMWKKFLSQPTIKHSIEEKFIEGFGG